MAQIGIVVTLDYAGCVYWHAIRQYELGFGVQHSLAMPDSYKLKHPALMKEIMQDLVIQSLKPHKKSCWPAFVMQSLPHSFNKIFNEKLLNLESQIGKTFKKLHNMV